MYEFYDLYLEQVKQGKFKMSSIEIGKRIKDIRISAGLNQRDFAKILETSSGYISGVESGKNMAGGDFLLRLHDKFNTNLHYLLTGIDLNLEQSAGVAAQNPKDLTNDENEVLDLYRKSNELGKAVILCAARGTEKNTNPKPYDFREMTMKEIQERAMGRRPNPHGFKS